MLPVLPTTGHAGSGQKAIDIFTPVRGTIMQVGMQVPVACLRSRTSAPCVQTAHMLAGAHVEAAQDQGLREDWAAFLANLGNQYIETDSAPGTVPTAQRSANDTSQQVAPMPAARNEYMDKPTKAENAHQPRVPPLQSGESTTSRTTSDASSDASSDHNNLTNSPAVDTDACDFPGYERDPLYARQIGLQGSELATMVDQYTRAEKHGEPLPYPSRPRQLAAPNDIGSVYIEGLSYSRRREFSKVICDNWKPSGGKIGSTILKVHTRQGQRLFRRKYGKIQHADGASADPMRYHKYVELNEAEEDLVAPAIFFVMGKRGPRPPRRRRRRHTSRSVQARQKCSQQHGHISI